MVEAAPTHTFRSCLQTDKSGVKYESDMSTSPRKAGPCSNVYLMPYTALSCSAPRQERDVVKTCHRTSTPKQSKSTSLHVPCKQAHETCRTRGAVSGTSRGPPGPPSPSSRSRAAASSITAASPPGGPTTCKCRTPLLGVAPNHKTRVGLIPNHNNPLNLKAAGKTYADACHRHVHMRGADTAYMYGMKWSHLHANWQPRGGAPHRQRQRGHRRQRQRGRHQQPVDVVAEAHTLHLLHPPAASGVRTSMDVQQYTPAVLNLAPPLKGGAQAPSTWGLGAPSTLHLLTVAT